MDDHSLSRFSFAFPCSLRGLRIGGGVGVGGVVVAVHADHPRVSRAYETRFFYTTSVPGITRVIVPSTRICIASNTRVFNSVSHPSFLFCPLPLSLLLLRLAFLFGAKKADGECGDDGEEDEEADSRDEYADYGGDGEGIVGYCGGIVDHPLCDRWCCGDGSCG